MIHRPSGDQLGCPTIGPPKFVMRTAFEPSAFETHTSREPERDEMKAIFLPSGEYFGVWSTRVEEMKSSACSGDRRFAAVPRARYSCPQFVASTTRWRPNAISETSSLTG